MSITFSSVILGGTITDSGESAVIERGIVYSSDDAAGLMYGSEDANVITETISGTGSGNFSKTIQNLMAGTTYRYRAYAINNEGTSHGDVRYFTTYIERPTVATAPANTIFSTSVILGGTIEDSGASAVEEIGIVYSSDGTAELIIAGEDNVTTKTISAVQSGDFSETIVNLTAKTTYYYKAYATNDHGTSYGDKETFTTTAKPTVITLSADDTSSSSVALRGEVTSEGGHSVTERGVVYFSDDTADLIIGGENVAKDSNGAGLGFFTESLIGLTESTAYRYRAYATNINGIAYGAVISFTTVNFKPLVATGGADVIEESVVILNGTIEDSGVEVLTEVGFLYSLTVSTDADLVRHRLGLDTEIDGGTDFNPPSSVVNFSTRTAIPSPIENENKAYYYRAYATNGRGVGYGDIRSFIIRNAPPVISVNNPSHTLIEGATETFELADVFSNADSYSVIEAQKPGFVTLEGSVLTFAPSFVGAADNSPYTFEVSAGNYRGEVSVSFTLTVTNNSQPVVTTAPASDITSTSATLNGDMTSNGGETIMERGFVYSTSDTDLTTANTAGAITVSGTGAGVFSTGITGLSQGTEYHYRAYATNSVGTVYGDVQSFTTATAAAPIIIDITVSSTGETITMQTNEPVILTNADNEDFTVTSTLNSVTTTHQVTSVTPGSIVLTVTPCCPSGSGRLNIL